MKKRTIENIEAWAFETVNAILWDFVESGMDNLKDVMDFMLVSFTDNFDTREEPITDTEKDKIEEVCKQYVC